MRALIVVALLCGGAMAQTRPNFSGSWKLNVARSDIQEPRLKGAVFKIQHQEPEFIISRTLLYSGEQQHMKFNLRTDGSPLVVPYGEEKLMLRVRWDDGSLLCSIRDALARDNADTVKYTLSPNGKVLTVQESGTRQRRVWVFEREQQ
jgi:hypothetical protein